MANDWTLSHVLEITGGSWSISSNETKGNIIMKFNACNDEQEFKIMEYEYASKF
jgi:hypothetical protein